jgi:hypothetical protein
MAEHAQQIKHVRGDDVVTRTTRDIDDDMSNAEPARVHNDYVAARIVWFIAGIILVLLAFRLVLMLLGANPSNAFAHFIYTVSYPFAVPFFGLFGYNLHYGVSRFEVSTLVAMAVYAIIAYGLARLLTIKRP